MSNRRYTGCWRRCASHDAMRAPAGRASRGNVLMGRTYKYQHLEPEMRYAREDALSRISRILYYCCRHINAAEYKFRFLTADAYRRLRTRIDATAAIDITLTYMQMRWRYAAARFNDARASSPGKEMRVTRRQIFRFTSSFT